jgi:phage terminase small subunit
MKQMRRRKREERDAKKRQLREKQKKFAYEYLVDHNATAAYKRAGYKCRGQAAESAASEIFRNPQVRGFINFLIAERAERTQITADMVVKETWIHAHRCIEAGDLAAANKALELVGKATGAFSDKMQHSGRVDIGNLQIVTTKAADELRAITEAARGIPVDETERIGERMA